MMMNTQKDELTDSINIKLTTLNLIIRQEKRCRLALLSHFSCELPKYRAFPPGTTSCIRSPLLPFVHDFTHFTKRETYSHNNVNVTNMYVCNCVSYLDVSLVSCKTGRPFEVGRHS